MVSEATSVGMHRAVLVASHGLVIDMADVASDNFQSQTTTAPGECDDHAAQCLPEDDAR